MNVIDKISRLVDKEIEELLSTPPILLKRQYFARELTSMFAIVLILMNTSESEIVAIIWAALIFDAFKDIGMLIFKESTSHIFLKIVFIGVLLVFQSATITVFIVLCVIHGLVEAELTRRGRAKQNNI